MTTSIVEALDSAAKGGYRKWVDEDRFRAPVIRAKKTLITLGVSAANAQITAERLARVGKQVHRISVYGIDPRLY